jgi:2-aminoadipate transaminase
MPVNWNNHLSTMAKERLSPSLLGDLFAIENEYKPICLSPGEPTQDLFPLEGLRPFFEKICDEPSLFGYYAYHAGHLGLREWINDWMHEDGVAAAWVSPANILLTTGSQQGLGLVGELLVDPGTVIALEAPTYIEALRAFRKPGASFVEVRMDDDGIIPESFEETCKKHKPSILYTIPNFQNPSGAVTSLERRKAILEIARKHDVVIIEDDPYRYISFMDHVPDSYMSLAGEDARVIYLGSFSKLICPGIRCGWMILPEAILKKMTQLRHTLEISLPASLQHVVSGFCHQIDRKSYLSNLQSIYRQRCKSLVQNLKETMVPRGLSMNSPKGGYFIWSTLPGIDDMRSFAEYAIKEHKISVTPGYIFFTEPGRGLDTLRFSFAKISPEMAKEGCERLASAYDSYVKKR